jgi:hypothetical protein
MCESILEKLLKYSGKPSPNHQTNLVELGLDLSKSEIRGKIPET